ncbi:chemotaxis protein CheD [Halobacillus shinanisalinarum]|uniref:Probable chemoreceptor glutamine deamidase CheD n=1 Tax=Halobacillus shinanisalinarum TaxID=2932258 RepID=A0ABY4GYZ4_9BACI|nr:chemotaxis protein CheD [Halobacillus shinanisalinarum]UOQ93241.1 chemotaxis protein CheD [Halobacillus shinanisalinarum]
MSRIVETVKVGIAELDVVKHDTLIRTSGLGSCVGLVLYDRSQEIAGMAHIMLPDSTLSKESSFNRAKYADTAIDDLVDKLIGQGAKKFRLTAKLAGGAQMFQFSTASDMGGIGSRNVAAVKKKLSQLTIPVESEDTGGNRGRTIEFNPTTSLLHIRTVYGGEATI